ncbi:ATP synthase F1 subunit epsilon [Candidatus Gottesmanbacteria bacterium]|nr:ATP synthase F1 subunit epsilon [Candidatus Gottesmanbacteria bacterium]
MSTFHLEIITPERIAYTDEVEMVTAPSSSGIIGILPHHVPLFTKLRQGEVKITKKGEESYLAIGGGFLEVTPEKVVILVTAAFHAHELNEQVVKEAQKRAEEALKSKPTGGEFLQAQALFRQSEIAMKVLKRRKYKA